MDNQVELLLPIEEPNDSDQVAMLFEMNMVQVADFMKGICAGTMPTEEQLQNHSSCILMINDIMRMHELWVGMSEEERKEVAGDRYIGNPNMRTAFFIAVNIVVANYPNADRTETNLMINQLASSIVRNLSFALYELNQNSVKKNNLISFMMMATTARFHTTTVGKYIESFGLTPSPHFSEPVNTLQTSLAPFTLSALTMFSVNDWTIGAGESTHSLAHIATKTCALEEIRFEADDKFIISSALLSYQYCRDLNDIEVDINSIAYNYKMVENVKVNGSRNPVNGESNDSICWADFLIIPINPAKYPTLESVYHALVNAIEDGNQDYLTENFVWISMRHSNFQTLKDHLKRIG